MKSPRQIEPSVLQRLENVRLLSCDVDGVLTDGGLYYFENGDEARKFNVKDGLGLQMVLKAGIQVAFVTASTTSAIKARAKRLGIPHLLVTSDKLAAVSALAKDVDVGLPQIAHMSDDLNDLPLLRAIGCPIAVADAVMPVREAACLVTQAKGGAGAAREICDLLLEIKAGTIRSTGRLCR